MVSINYSPNIPNSILKDCLIEKANELREVPVDLFYALKKFIEKVSNEAPFLWDTFSDYTPHDEKHHIIPLFHISDEIIGEGYKQFSFPELYLLIVGLYGHDWGMVISQEFKEYILNQTLPPSSFNGNKNFLTKEREVFSRFIKDEGIMVRGDNNYENLSNSLWEKYVRDTHALRSSYRVEDFFSDIDAGIAAAAGKICLGHTLDFRDLERNDDYPQNHTVYNKPVNLKAITLYLRIFDLFDISKYRTPSEIYDYLSPKSEDSILHWKKHFSIDSFAVDKMSDNGRKILVRGSTNDPEVYALLEDIRNLCKYELDRTVEIFYRMNDGRHIFKNFYLDWHISTDKFNGLSVRFEFERNDVFKILSSEIYQRNPFVFIRELLQNSIDAIRLKEEFYRKMNEPSFFHGFIKVDIIDQTDGGISVKWYDNGIGMDEYIVKNYFSVIGKSFYEKSNLDKLGITLDPISKFGIGILSCFYVANDMEILTYKDTIIDPNSIPLEIRIPEVTKHFRVRELQRGSIKQGTEIKILLEKSKIFKNVKIGISGSTNGIFTQYLKSIAGFVEFPIVITENETTTIILHPDSDSKSVPIINDYPGYSIEKIQYDYPFSSIFLDQDIEVAKKEFKPKIINLQSDLQLKDLEGAITCLYLPNNLEWYQKSSTGLDSQQFNGIKIINPNPRENDKVIRWHETWFEYSNINNSESNFRLRNDRYAIFKDGILLQNERNPLGNINGKSYRDLPPPILIINILNNGFSEINVARTNLFESEKHWSSQIEEALIQFFINKEIIPLHTQSEEERWYHIGRLLLIYPISERKFVSAVSNQKIPIVSLEQTGKLKFTNIGEIDGDTVHALPESLTNEFLELINKNLVLKTQYEGILKHWCGDSCFGIGRTEWSNIRSITKAYDISSDIFDNDFICSELEFLHPPHDGYPPLRQKIYRKKQNTEDLPIQSMLEKALKTPQLLTPFEINQLNKIIKMNNSLRMPQIYHFSEVYKSYFAFGWQEMNYDHPITHKFIQLIVRLAQKGQTNSEQIIIGKILDRMTYISNFQNHQSQFNCLKKILLEILNLSRDLGLVSDNWIAEISAMENIFIPNSFHITTYYSTSSRVRMNPLFGRKISTVAKEDT